MTLKYVLNFVVTSQSISARYTIPIKYTDFYADINTNNQLIQLIKHENEGAIFN
jgi:hypothetical protein